ncbi:MAG: DUF6562 domain-containing protein, partial [Rikenellaceae bacterium]
FAQVNVTTYLTDVIADMYPASVKVEYVTALPTGFNALTAEIAESTISSASFSTSTISNLHLSTDYIFAPEGEQNTVDFEMTFYDADGKELTTNDKFVNIPVQRNYRTNVSGELLTLSSTINVTITPDFDGTIENTVINDATELNETIVADKAVTDDLAYTIASLTEGDNIVVNGMSTDNIIFNIESVNDDDDDKTITFAGDANGNESNYSGTVYINSEITIENLTFNMPNATIVFNGTVIQASSASGPNTFIVAEGASVGTLTVEKGNVEIYGSVDTVKVASTNLEVGTIKVFEGGSLVSSSNLENYTVVAVATTQAFLTAQLANDAVNAINIISDFTLTEEITVTKPINIISEVTFDGAKQQITTRGSGRFVIKSNVTLDNMIIASETTIKTGTIYVEDANCTLNIKNSTIDYNLTGESTTVLNDGVVVVNPESGIDGVHVVITSSTINLNGVYQTGVAFMPEAQQYNSSLTLDNTLIFATTDNPNNATYTAGLSLGKIENFKFDIKNGSEIRNVYYGYLGYKSYPPSNVDIDITDSEISGYGIMFRAMGGTFDITRSTIIGRNYYSTNSDFGTIVFTYDGTYDSPIAATKDVALTIDASTIKSYRSGVCDQWIIEVRKAANTGNTINIINGTTFIDEVADGVDNMVYMIELADDGDNGTVVTSDGTEVLVGKADVRLLKAIDLEGSGTSNDPYIIYEAYEMESLTRSTLSGYYELGDNIDADGYSWEDIQIGYGSQFDGKGYYIENYNFNSVYTESNLNGVFSQVLGTLQNLTVKNSSLSVYETSWSTFSTGGIAGCCTGLIDNCHAEIDIQTYHGKQDVYNGGIVGKLIGGTINNCTFSGSISIYDGHTKYTYSGGIAGWLSASSTITNCTFSGTIAGTITGEIAAMISDNCTLTESGNKSTGTVNP